jgi:hypothetical protein
MSEEDEIIVPAKFQSIIRDFTRDLSTTFPEYSILWRKWTADEVPEREVEKLFKYCTEVYPERFFDILYQNDDIFKDESDANTRFLPAVEFRLLYNCEGVSATTRSAIWKYLQLVLLSVVNSIRDKSAFGDAANMFEGVDEAELQGKLNETLAGIAEFFKNMGPDAEEPDAEKMKDFMKQFTEGAEETIPGMEEFAKSFVNGTEGTSVFPGMEEFAKTFAQAQAQTQGSEGEMPSADDLHEHLKGLFDGKIGSLAKELAEEITGDVESMFSDGTDTNDIRSTGDMINKIIKNPKQVMGLMKTISGKLQQKMKSGEISEEEIMKEASEIMGKMKGMKGMGQMGDMFKNLAKGMGGGSINTGAIQRMQRQMAAKERMRAKMESKHIEKTESGTSVFRLDGEAPEYSVAPTPPAPALSDKELVDIFSSEKPAKKSGKKKGKK